MSAEPKTLSFTDGELHAIRHTMQRLYATALRLRDRQSTLPKGVLVPESDYPHLHNQDVHFYSDTINSILNDLVGIGLHAGPVLGSHNGCYLFMFSKKPMPSVDEFGAALQNYDFNAALKSRLYMHPPGLDILADPVRRARLLDPYLAPEPQWQNKIGSAEDRARHAWGVDPRV